MKILFCGDSITDMGRDRLDSTPAAKMGLGYPNFIAGELLKRYPNEYEFINRGVSGNRIVDLQARIKADVWNHSPDVLSILIGVNDVWHEVEYSNGVEIDRWETLYRILIEETKERLPKTQIMICEPFVLKGTATEEQEKWERFLAVRAYANVAKRLAEEYGLAFVPLQGKFDILSKKYGVENYLYDGVHPAPAGAKIIAEEWLKVFKQMRWVLL